MIRKEPMPWGKTRQTQPDEQISFASYPHLREWGILMFFCLCHHPVISHSLGLRKYSSSSSILAPHRLVPCG